MTDKTLYIISTPIGNLKDFSFRGVETLEKCDLILCEDTRVSLKFLNHYKIKKPLMKCEKYSEESVAQNVDNLFFKNNTVGLITDAGTPCVSDPGSLLVDACHKHDINVFAVPGCSAVVYALSVSGFNNNNFSFLGFLPREKSKQQSLFKSLENNSSNLNCFVFYESPNRILSTLENLTTIQTEKVCVVKEATKLFEKKYIGKLDDIISLLKEDEKTNKGEYVCVFTIKQTVKHEKSICLEALLLNEMKEKNLTAKDAIKSLSNDYARNELYEASLNLKNFKI